MQKRIHTRYLCSVIIYVSESEHFIKVCSNLRYIGQKDKEAEAVSNMCLQNNWTRQSFDAKPSYIVCPKNEHDIDDIDEHYIDSFQIHVKLPISIFRTVTRYFANGFECQVDETDRN